ncbi:esterase/lipase family protein [Nonomuraea sp. SBT364]|uniref:esterase/lipase family protein n=1 Tax=Nonomuraea sp. SBT364 TaxID=1580530 RepID=UPI00066AA93C|nr:alpha/beta fold hydrolase [Nonomuraea sp. SBT364]
MPIHNRGLTVTASLCLVAVTAVAAAPAASAGAAVPDPRGVFPVHLAYSLLDPDRSPPGANDWSCEPSRRHPEPVVLVHGTYGNAYNSWRYMAPDLKREGHCVFAINYGAPPGSPLKATGDIRRSGRELARFVDRVLAATGARRVALVGHSQGGMMPRWYLRHEGGADARRPWRNKVSKLVSLAATHHGTTVDGVMSMLDVLGVRRQAGAVISKAAVQQATGSEFMVELNRGGDTMPGIRYTVLATRYDEIATPFTSTFLSAGPGAEVRNIVLQDGCAIDLTEHLAIIYDPRALHYVKNALSPGRERTPAGRKAVCLPVVPVAGAPITS